MAQLQAVEPPKAIRYGGKPQKITPEIVERVVAHRFNGVSLRRSLSMEDPPIGLNHWESTLNRRPELRALYLQKEGAAVEDLLLALRAAAPGQWQKIAWILERVFGDDYSSKPSVQVTHNTLVVGMGDDVIKRAKALIKAGREPKAIDV